DARFVGGRLLKDTSMTGFLLWVLVVVLREVLRPSTSGVDAVVGALCGFLLILFVFMRVHRLIEALRPDSYRTDGPPFSQRSDEMLVATFQYFGTIKYASAPASSAMCTGLPC